MPRTPRWALVIVAPWRVRAVTSQASTHKVMNVAPGVFQRLLPRRLHHVPDGHALSRPVRRLHQLTYAIADDWAKEAAFGCIDTDLTSSGCGHLAPPTTTRTDAGPAPVPWVSTSLTAATGTAPVAKAQGLEDTLANVAALTIDTHRECLGRGFPSRVTSDGPTTLQLSDGRRIALNEGINEGHSSK